MQKSPGIPDLFTFSYEGGDSEFFNYLMYTIKLRCEESVFKLFKKNKEYINLFKSV